MEQIKMAVNDLMSNIPQQNNPLSEVVATCVFGVCSGDGIIRVERGDYETVRLCECSKLRDRKRIFGERFYKINLLTIEPRNENQSKLKQILIETPSKNLFIHGQGGLGKTHFLVACYIFWDKKNARVKYLEDAWMKKELRSAELENDWEYPSNLVSDYDHFFIEDIGKEIASEFYRAALFQIFNELYKQKKHLFMTSNFSLQTMSEAWGGSIVRRIEEICEVVELK